MTLDGVLITFEGLDGCGKTTQLRMLESRLREAGYKVITTREPGGTPIGERIRDLLHDMRYREMTGRTEVLLFSASRAQLVEQIIRPRLAEGYVVMMDRFYDSTLAYQGYGRGLELEGLELITRFATGGLTPDLTFYLDIEPEEGLRRRRIAAANGGEWTRLDAQEMDFYRRVRAGYHALARRDPERWAVLDGTMDAQELSDAVLEIALRVCARLK